VEEAPRILNGVKEEELIRHETQDVNQLMGRPIHEFQLSDILVATDIEGGLHALNRETGEVVWSLEVDEPLVSVQSNFSQDGETSTDDSIVWIVEPYGDGNLYMFNKEIGLTKLPVSISQLVLQSPFALNGDDKVYTGLRKSSLYTIDIATGEIVTTYGVTSNFKTDYCSGDKEDCSTVVVLGKTSYELTIHSKDNTYWNVTYSTWGPNNIDIDLAMQNKIPLDGTYIAPFHDSTILAIDINSKIAKWVSQLPYTVVNVFDILRDSRENLEGKSFIVVPHPLKPPEGFSGVQNEGTYLDMTLNRSWYAMSSEYYPSLVQSAPASRYSMSERWRSPQILNSPQYFSAAIIGVHQPSNSEAGFDFDPTGAIAGYPTNFPQHYPNHQAYNTETPRTNEVGIYQPPSRSEWLSLPSSSTPVLQIDPSPMGKKGFFDTAFGNFLYRCLENLVMIAILSLVLYIAVKLEWLPSLNVLLRNNGLELKELEGPVFEAPKSAQVQDEPQSENHSLKPLPKIREEASSSPNDETNHDTDDPPEIGSEVRKEVTIVEPPLEERVSHENSGAGLKKRKRGSRGGKKSKKNQEAKDTPQHSPSNSSSNNEIVSAGDQSTDKLSLTDEVLGYGSYGTVVFKGVFQGRDVAVKRMLIDFYDVASHEIGLLTESDDHPNVIRYFYNETNDKFLFIALELCSASLEDVIEKSMDFPDLVRLMEPVNVLEQIAKGLHHLHSLKIVHRDIKPQNILVAPPKKLKTRQESFTPVRILISDFGLCKRLEADESSFRATTQHAAGTSGWRAPELLVDEGSYSFSSISMSSDHSFNTSSNSIAEPLVFDTLSKRRLTRAIDIFSLGCLFYYILTNGGHPFGDRYLREGNVIKGQYNLDLLDILPENVFEAKDLISKMISRNPKLRPNTDQVLKHPFFWSNTKKLDFLLKVSDRYEVERRDPPSEMLQQLETIAATVIGDDWTVRFEKIFMDNLGKYRKYHGDRVMDLLRALRNKYHHFNDLPVDLAGKMGPLPDGFYRYFNSKFPRLLMEIYGVVEKNLIDDHVLGTFF
jgi:serine/threonine-protein kinase/endoribonuclease IRE1